jgi:outer membrane receptor protein involved in Fe transport
MNMHRYSAPRANLLLALGCAALLPAVFAQQAPTPPATEAPAKIDEPVIELSPFEVKADKDLGYSAQNTASGSRLSTSLKDTPAPITVFTAEFIQDIAATNIAEVAEYAPNTQRESGIVGNTANGNVLGEFDTQFRVRGQPTSNTGRAVNFFQSILEVDVYNTERIEQSRGPNSILFGLGSAAGVFNVTTKKADPAAARASVTLRTGSYEALRVATDVNQPIIRDVLALRVNLLDDSKNGYRPHEFRNQERLHLAGHLRLFKKFTLDAEYEKAHVEQSVQRSWTSFDSITDWIALGRQLDPAAGSPFPTAAGLATLGANSRFTYDSAAGTILNQRNQTVSAPTRSALPLENPLILDFSLVPRDAVLGGPGVGASVDSENYSAFLRGELWPKLHLEVAGNHQEAVYLTRDIGNNELRINYDTNAQLPGGAANPKAGRPYIETQMLRRNRFEDIDDFRAALSYELDLGKILGRHSLAGLAERREQHTMREEQGETVVQNPANTADPGNANNRFFRRTYVDLGGPVAAIALADFRDHPVNGVVNASTGLPVSTAFVNSQNVNDDTQKLTTLMFAAQSRFWNDRLVTTLGYREDDVDSYIGTAVRAPAFGPFAQGAFVAQPATAPVALKGITRTQGGVFHATNWLALAYNRSSNFSTPNNQIRTLPKDPLPAPRSQSEDISAKFTLLHGRIFATVLYYQTTAINDSGFMGRVDQNNINSIWTTLNSAGLLTAAGKTLDAVTVDVNGFTFDSASQGWEAELVANITNQWRLSLNVSDNKMVRTNSGPAIFSYMAANRDFWTQGTGGRLIVGGAAGALAANAVDATDGVTTVAETLNTVDASLADRLTKQDGLVSFGSPRRSLNLRTNYTFGNDRLKGFSVGGGARWRGAPIIGTTTADPATREEIKGDDYLLLDLNVGYQRKLGLFGRKPDWSLQLNINNLLDEDELIRTNAFSDGSTRLYRFQTPREWILSTTLRF